MTVLAFERLPVEPGHLEALEARLRIYVDEMRAAPGVLWADAARAFDDDPSYVLASEWRTEADAAAWDASTAATAFQEDADVLLRGEVTRRRFTGTV